MSIRTRASLDTLPRGTERIALSTFKIIREKLIETAVLVGILILLCFAIFVWRALVYGFLDTWGLIVHCLGFVLEPLAPYVEPFTGHFYVLFVIVPTVCAFSWLLVDLTKWCFDGCPSEALLGDTTNPQHSDYPTYRKRNSRIVEAYVEEKKSLDAIAAECYTSKANVRLVLKRSGVQLRDKLNQHSS